MEKLRVTVGVLLLFHAVFAGPIDSSINRKSFPTKGLAEINETLIITTHNVKSFSTDEITATMVTSFQHINNRTIVLKHRNSFFISEKCD